jgi:predicted TIM-barrel fold metal-dependent hydrolase
MRMIDADSHVIESEECWQYLDPAYHARRPIPVTVPADTSFLGWNAFWLIDRKVRHFGATPATSVIAKKKQFNIGIQQITDVPSRLAEMDRMQVEKQVVHPSFCLSTMTEDPELEAALMRSYNSFMADKCRKSGGRIFFNAVVPFRSPDVAVEEIRRLRKLDGMASVLVRGIEWDKPIDHPAHYPVYEEAQRQGLPMVVHLGPGCPAISDMFDGQPRPKHEAKTFFPPRGRRLVSTLTVQYGLYCLLESPLIDDFPTLKWAFLEGGGSEWAISAILSIGRAGKDCERYFREGRVFMGAEPDEHLPWVAERLGTDCLVASSDMPHYDEAAHDNVVEEFEARGDLAPDMLQKLLRENALKLFDFGGGKASAAKSREAVGAK